jgi:glycosyltransferase involved in cell wall biosynthesis
MPQATLPLLILCDSIANTTGLARVGRDLAVRIHCDLADHFRVACLGVGGPISTSSRFPFQNGSILYLQQMVPLDLPAFWLDHAGRVGDGKQEDSAEDLTDRPGQPRKGIILAAWNISWCQWLAQPDLLPPSHPLREFLLSKPFARWLYCPVDGHLPDGTLGEQIAPILAGFDRVATYTRYGAEVIERTLGKWDSRQAALPVSLINSVPDLPLGLDRAVFYPRDRALARQIFFSRISNGGSAIPLLDDQVLLCMVGTNTTRKLWGEAFQTCAELVRRGVNVFFWGHTDCLTAPPGYWNLPALVKQYGMDQRTVLTTDRLSDDDMAWSYSAMDAMLATSSEGFGYTPFESLACGLPTVATSYAGSAEFIPKQLQVDSVSYQLESPFLIQRPLHSPHAVADKVIEVINNPAYDHLQSLLDPKYEWSNLWPRWREWFLEGIGE